MTKLSFSQERSRVQRSGWCAFGALCALSLSVIAGCGPGRTTWQPNTDTSSTTTGSGTVTASGTVASGTPREQLEQLDGVLRGQGFTALAPAIHGDLQTHGLVAYAIDAEANSCYALAAIGEVDGQNLDMIVLDPYGRPATHHVRPDNHPWVSFCAGSEGRFIARVQMASGSGSYYFAQYASSGGNRMELSSFFGDEPSANVQVAQMDAPTQQRLSTLDARMQQQGYQRAGQASGVVLNTAAPRDFQLNLTQGTCYAFAALGGSGAVDTEIALDDAGGQRLVVDETTAQDSVIEHCAQGSGSYSLAVRMAQGQGALFTVGYVRGAAAGGPVISGQSTAHAGLQENFALLDADMRARGYESYGETATGNLQQGGTRDFSIELEGGKCYAILAVGDGTVRDMDLVLLDSNQREVDRDTAGDARPTVRVCPTRTGRFIMQARMSAGSGSYVYAQYRWPRGVRGPFGLEGVTWVRLSEVTALLGVEGYNPDPGFTPGSGTLRRQGATATHNVQLEAGQCYAVVAVGGEGVNDLDVTLSRGGTQLINDFGSRNAFPSVRQCVTAGGNHTITITAAAGQGSYHYQIFSRGEEQ